MASGWTGGQYSMLRVVLAAFVAVRCVQWLSPWLAVPAVAACLLLAIGLAPRLMAVLLFPALALKLSATLAGLTLMQAVVPPKPFLSWGARRRLDPAGAWRLSHEVPLFTWTILALGYGFLGLRPFRWEAPWWLGAGLVFPVLALIPRARPWAWLGFLVASIVAMAVWGGPVWWSEFVLMHLFTFDPRWIPPRLPLARETMFFDGSCGLCHRSVAWMLAEDRNPTSLDFAPLAGAEFERDVPDSLVVRTADGGLLVKSAAVLHLARRLGGLWRVLATVAAVVPRPLRDVAYDLVAANRKRLFRTPESACPVVPPSLRRRFR